MARFHQELAKGLASPAYLLYAEDPFLLKEALYAAKKSLPGEQVDFLFHVYDRDAPEDAPPVEHIVDTLLTVSLMGGRKVVAVENAQKLTVPETKTLGRYLERPSPEAVLILLYAGSLKRAAREGLKGLKQIALDIRERDLPSWVRQRAGERGIALTGDAVDYLIGTVGPDAGLLSSEIEKLTLAGKKTLSREDIAELVKGAGDYDVFDLIGAIERRDEAGAFRICRALSRTQEPYSLLGALNWHFSRVKAAEARKSAIFALLSEADLLMKSSGAYPMEYLLFRLLRT
ncbi:MAG: DNA polymerase III subunit delta [Nitrospirota bacterium]